MSLSNSPGRTLRGLWRALRFVPGGRVVFSKLVGMAAPYTGTIGARVVDLAPGYAKVALRDRRQVRNHLSSVHAVALTNLAEMTTGLAMSMGMPDGTRGILTGLSMEYLKKARGRLTAECRCEVPTTNERRELTIRGDIMNAEGEVVARATARWLVGPSR
jgi:acyl-coenzyme A thioesterase PaaI-like protein